MYICYIDESGTPDLPGNTSHFVLAGLAIPVSKWKSCDKDLINIKKQFDLENEEIHVGWLLRPYPLQRRISRFESLSYKERRSRVESLRKEELLRLQRSKNRKRYSQEKKNLSQTSKYFHLTEDERREVVVKLAKCVSRWSFARLFAECIDKVYFDPTQVRKTVSEQAFEQLVSRFEQFLQIIEKSRRASICGLLIHDNNQTVAKRLTLLMKRYHQSGTLWAKIKRIIETPLFVDSQLTSMVQIADLCSYALRRYLENDEDKLFDLVFKRADRKDGTVVGIRHYTQKLCECKICVAHRKK